MEGHRHQGVPAAARASPSGREQDPQRLGQHADAFVLRACRVARVSRVRREPFELRHAGRHPAAQAEWHARRLGQAAPERARAGGTQGRALAPASGAGQREQEVEQGRHPPIIGGAPWP